MKQAALCGLLGYRDFFSPEWLSSILSWQDKTNGCYRWAAWPMKQHEPHKPTKLMQMVIAAIRQDPIRSESDNKFILHDRVKREEKRVKREEKRVKREEKRVSHGCLCHKTTVASSALAQYARFFLEDFLANNNQSDSGVRIKREMKEQFNADLKSMDRYVSAQHQGERTPSESITSRKLRVLTSH